MKSNNKGNQYDLFDHDFEVTCDVDLSDIKETYYNKGSYHKEDNYYDDYSDDTVDDEYDDEYDDDDYYGEDEAYDDDPDMDYYEDDYDDYTGSKSGKRNCYNNGRKGSKKKKNRRKAPNLMKPVQKTVQTGGKIVGKLLQSVSRIATLVLIAAIMAVMGTRFWETHNIYGNLNTAVSEKNYALAAYLGVGAMLLFFEFITFLWAMTSEKVREGRRNRRQDVGRGFASFFFIYAGSYMSMKFGNLLPDSTVVLQALKAALALYGSMNMTLLILGIAGMVSCIFRRFAYR